MFRLGRHDQICFSCKMMEVISAEEKSGEGAGEYIRVHFRVKCPIRLGQSLAISGSSFSLGAGQIYVVALLLLYPHLSCCCRKF